MATIFSLPGLNFGEPIAPEKPMLSDESTDRLAEAASRANEIYETEEATTPDQALAKAAEEFSVPPRHLPFLVTSWNAANQNTKRVLSKRAAEKYDAVPLASLHGVMSLLFPTAKKAEEQLLQTGTSATHWQPLPHSSSKTPTAPPIPENLPWMSKKAEQATPIAVSYRRAVDDVSQAWKDWEVKKAATFQNEVAFDAAVSRIESYFLSKRAEIDRPSWGAVEKAVQGSVSPFLLDQIHRSACSQEKRASEALPLSARLVDRKRDEVLGLFKQAAESLARLRQSWQERREVLQKVAQSVQDFFATQRDVLPGSDFLFERDSILVPTQEQKSARVLLKRAEASEHLSPIVRSVIPGGLAAELARDAAVPADQWAQLSESQVLKKAIEEARKAEPPPPKPAERSILDDWTSKKAEEVGSTNDPIFPKDRVGGDASNPQGSPAARLVDVLGYEEKVGTAADVFLGTTLSQQMPKYLGTPKTPNDRVEEVIANDLQSPSLQAEMRKVRAQTILSDLIANNPVISSYPVDEVLQRYNELAAVAPHAASKSLYATPWLERMLTGHIDPSEPNQLTELEDRLASRGRPPASVLSSSPALRGGR